jgi:GT2 family glycosyltransferase
VREAFSYDESGLTEPLDVAGVRLPVADPRDPITLPHNAVVVAAVVPFFNGPEGCLERTLRGLLQQTRPVDRVVVVDDGSSTPASIPSGLRPTVELTRLPNNVGTSQAKNSAAALIKSDYLLFVNEDIVLKPDWLEHALSFMESNLHAAAVGGAIVPILGPKLLREWRLQFIETKVQRSRPTEPQEQNWLIGHAILVRRSVFDELGGFDQRFRCAADDWDFSQRARSNGHTLFYLPQLVAECNDPTSLEYLARKNVRNSGWDLRPRSLNPPACAAVRPMRPIAATASVFRNLVHHSSRNALKGRISFLLVDVAVAFRSLIVVWRTWRA